MWNPNHSKEMPEIFPRSNIRSFAVAAPCDGKPLMVMPLILGDWMTAAPDATAADIPTSGVAAASRKSSHAILQAEQMIARKVR